MRRAGLYILLVLIVAALAAVIFEARRGSFRRNHLKYLVNDHRYLEALTGYERLAAESGANPMPHFEAGLLVRARDYYNTLDMSAGSPEERAYQEFIDAAIARPNLADDARRLRLDLFAGRDGAATTTLAAAEAILQHRYDPEALWWATRCQYDPARPLAVPKRLLEFAPKLDQAAASPADDEPRRAARTRFLKAVANLADQNWAGAAALLESGTPPEQIDADMALGIALLRAGRPEAAIAPLERQRRLRPADRLALEWLAEAYLGARVYPWALQALRELAAVDPNAADRALAEAVTVHAKNPFQALCTVAAENRDAELWAFLERLATTPERWADVYAAATRLCDAKAPLPIRDDAALMVESALRRGSKNLVSVVETRLITQAGDEVVQSLLTVLRGQQPRAEQRLNVFLRPGSTQRMKIQIPRGARVLAIQVQGYPVGAVWPIVHLDLGKHGRRTVDASESRAQAKPFLFVVPENTEGAVELSASVLNSGAGLGALVAEAKAY